MRAAVSPEGLWLEHHLARSVSLYALVGQCRACDLAAKLLQRLAIVSAAARVSAHAETIEIGIQRLL